MIVLLVTHGPFWLPWAAAGLMGYVVFATRDVMRQSKKNGEAHAAKCAAEKEDAR